MGRAGLEIRFLDTLLVPDDEVVFFRFAAQSSSDVEQASTLAELPFERINEYLQAPEATDDHSGTSPGPAAARRSVIRRHGVPQAGRPP